MALKCLLRLCVRGGPAWCLLARETISDKSHTSAIATQSVGARLSNPILRTTQSGLLLDRETVLEGVS